MMKKIFWFLICAALFACTDDNNFTDTPAKPVFMDETVLARRNDFHGINIPGDADWEVTEHPFWAVPMKYEGTAGTPLQIFVELNDEDEDRRDTLLVDLANGSTVTIPLRQHGLASSDENSSITIDARTLNQVYGVGFGVDVVEKSGMTGIKYNVKDASPFNFGYLQQVIEKKNWDDVIIDEPVYSSRYETITGSSTDALSNQLGINAGIEVGIKAFKFNVEAGFSSSSSGNTRNSYAMLEMQHIVGSRYFRGGMMRYLAEHADEMDKLLVVKTKNKFAPKTESPSLFQKTFNQQVGKLKESSSKGDVQAALQKLVQTYGTHVITRGTLGGELCVSMRKEEDNSSSGTSIHAALGVSAKVLDAEGNFKMDDKDSAATANTTISLRSYGGINAFTIAPGTTFEGFLANLRGKDHRADSTISINMWAEGIRRKDSIMVKDKKEPSLALIDMETIPLWDLMPDERTRTLMRNYIVKDYQESVARNHNTTFTPDLFLVNGYDVTTNAPGSGSIYIPEIDMQMVFERTIIDKLDPNELSTVVYSGTKDNVNRNRGFFVGSSTRKPCKFCFEKNGSFTTEEFDRLSKGPICELYVDVTGDITIAPKGINEMYVTCSVNNWKHDLKVLTSDWTCKDDITVTGKTDHCIHIADGKTLTLDNVTVNNQIVCDGNATLVLKDGTKNTIICPDDFKAGIQVGPRKKTLTLSGNGELETRGGKDAPGIGGSRSEGSVCGNITITGGVITAKAGTGVGSPGIGSFNGLVCGNITITGGTITAVGCTNGSAIGSSLAGNCGKIEISGGTVTAQGTLGAAGIGSGLAGSCEDILINGGTIYAKGCNGGAGIGSGKEGVCGNITITKDVTYVEATCERVEGNCYAIGQGENGTCGIVTIEDKSKVKQNNPNTLKINLDELTKDFELPETKCTLFGSTKYAIMIPDGLQVELAEAYVRNHVTCEGNATIILKEGTESIIGNLLNGPAGTTLTIDGKGKLSCDSSGSSGRAGIGGRAGNIHIKGGEEILCWGRDNAPGIGSAPGETVGDITISGGTVMSMGGPAIGAGVNGAKCGNIQILGGNIYATNRHYQDCPAIGCGPGSSCGNITIKSKAVIKVEIPGGSTMPFVGAASTGSCGSVTIENNPNYTEHYWTGW